MTTLRQSFKWPQGEDLKIQLVYKEGDSATKAAAVSLGSGYAVRMDLVVPRTTVPLHSINSDTDAEAVLTSGSPNISIHLPRSLTLPGGVLHSKMTATPPVNSFAYELFLRNKITDTQIKILMGTITVEASTTLWL